MVKVRAEDVAKKSTVSVWLLPEPDMELELLAYEFFCWQRVSVVPAGPRKGRAETANPTSPLLWSLREIAL